MENSISKKRNIILRPPSLRAREQFLEIEEKYEAVLNKFFGGDNFSKILELLTDGEIKEIQENGEISSSTIQRLLQSEEGRKALLQTPSSVKEEKLLNKALQELLTVIIDWEKTKLKKEEILSLTMDEILELIIKFRAQIKRR